MPPAEKSSAAPREALRSAAPLQAPRFAAAWAALVYVLSALTLGFPALAGRFLVNPHSDQYIAGFAFRDFAAQSLRAGEGFPMWNPFMHGGMPYMAAMHGDIFYPTFLLRMVMPTDAAMTWGFIVHLVLAGLFTYGFLRAWGLGFHASLIGGLAYMMGGPVASYVSPGHDGKLFVSALLPLGLWLMVRGVRDGRLWAWGTFALVVALAALSPHPQLFQYFLLACGAFALYCGFSTREDGLALPTGLAVKRLALGLGAVVLGAAGSAVQYLPVRHYVEWSPRAGGRGYDYSTSFSFPVEELFNTYLPEFTGILDQYWGRNGIHFHSEYLGAAVLLLAAAGLWSSRRGFRWFWIGTAVVSCLWMLGGNTPFFRLVYALVPGTKFFRAPSTIVYVFAFAVAVLAALGVERMLARQLRPRFALGWLAAGAVLALLGTAGALTNLGEALASGMGTSLAAARGMDPIGTSDYFAQRASANGAAVMAGSWRSFLFVALAAGLLLAFLRGRVAPRVLAWALVAVVAADLWSVARRYWIFSAPADVLYAGDPVIDLLKQPDTEQGRVLVLAQGEEGLSNPDPYFGTDGQGRGTGLMVHGIRSVSGYHGNQLGRYKLLEEQQTQSGPLIATPMFWRHENVRYLYTNSALEMPDFRLLAGPVRNSAGSTVYLYRLPGDNPPAWLAPATARVPDESAVQALMDPRFDPRRVAVVSDTAPLDVPELQTLPEPLSHTVTLNRPTTDRLEAALSAPAPAGAMLVVSENYYPGWRATVDGREAQTIRANYNLIGVPLPEGAQRVELRFTDPGYQTGKTVTIISLLLAALLAAAGVLVERRGRGARA